MLLIFEKNEKAHSEEPTKGVAAQSPCQEIIHISKQPFQWKPGPEMELYPETRCQLGLKGTDSRQNEGRLSVSWDFTGDNRIFDCKHALSFKKRD